MKDACGSLVLVVALLLVATPAAGATLGPGGTFVDDEENVHESMIEAIAADAITKGCDPPGNTHYCPDDLVSRGQMAAFLVRALDLPASGTDHFEDDDGSVFEADIQALREAGITKGCNPPANDRFCPDDRVTRGEMAAFLTRAFDYDATGEDHFTDDGDSVFASDINAMADAGVTKGCNPPDNTNFCPDDSVTRDQMASFLGRALGLAPVSLPPRMDLLEDFALTCSTPWAPERTHCVGEGVWTSGTRFYIRHGWPSDEASDSDVEFRLYLNGTAQIMDVSDDYEIDGEPYRLWTQDFIDGGIEGETMFVWGEWLLDGDVTASVDLDITFE